MKCLRQYPALLFLLACALLAFFIRASTYHEFINPHGELVFIDPDSYDHLRRITMGIASFPKVPFFDSYYGFPVGSGQIWAPLFDYLISTALFLAGAARHGRSFVENAGFWISPALAVVTVFQVFHFGRLIFNRTAGLVAALILAILPAHIMYSFAGQLDHHVAEPIVCMLIMGSILKHPRTRLHWLATGSWMVIALLIWRGSVVFWGIAVIALLLQSINEERDEKDRSLTALYGIRTCLAAAALLLPICIFDIWGSSSGISFETVSWFHILLLLTSAAALALAGKGCNRSRLKLAAALLCLAGIMVVVTELRLERFLSELQSGLAVMFSKDPWLDSISELHSIIHPEDRLDFGYAALFMSGLYFLNPLVIFLVYRSWKRSNLKDPKASVFLVWGTLFFILPLFRERYMHLAAVTTALGAGYLFSELKGLFPSSPAWKPAMAGSSLLLLLMAPSYPFLRDPAKEVRLSGEEKHELREALAWLREKTPITSGFTDPQQKPEYGVLAHWSLGSLVNYLGQRPTLATNFGWETHGLYESSAFLSITNPAVADRILQDNRIRYLLLGNHNGALKTAWDIASQGVARKKLPLAMMTPFDPRMSIYYRLYFEDGSEVVQKSLSVEALERYRLVHCSQGARGVPPFDMVPYYKIFEHVPGVRLTGKAAPHAEIVIRLRLKNRDGKLVVYQDVTRSGGSGDFFFHLPYSTDRNSGDFAPQGDYLLSINGTSRLVGIKEADVVTGNTIQLSP